MENFRTAYSDLKDTAQAVKSIREQLSGIDASLVLFFVSSSTHPVDTVNSEMAAAFAGIDTVGCTSAGEMVNSRMGSGAIAAMAFSKASMEFLQIEVIENINTDMDAVAKAFKSFEKSLGEPMKTLDPEKYAGLLIFEGLCFCEEQINDRIGNLTNVPFVGGTAGYDFNFKYAPLFVNGKVYPKNAAVLVLMKPTNGYCVLKTQSFIISDKKLTPTKVDESRRMVIEFDGKPAAETFAELYGETVEYLAANPLAHHVGVVLDEKNYFVRVPAAVDGTNLIFYCIVKEGLELSILKPGDIVEDTRAALQECFKKCGKPSAVIDFNCSLRNAVLAQRDQFQAYSELFGDVPAIGCATFGESYIGHMNETSTMLVFK